MLCENSMCLHNDEKHHCLLNETSINDIGMCNECMLLTPEQDKREEMRREILKSLLESFGK